MGRKKNRSGAALRAKKRADALQNELVQDHAKHVETKRIVEKTNQELFVVDKSVPQQQVPEIIQEKKKRQHSKLTEHVRVKELLKRHDATTLQQLASHKRRRKSTDKPSFDLWSTPAGNDKYESSQAAENRCGIGSALAGTAPAFCSAKSAVLQQTKKQVAVQVAHGGQSYHPDETQHQDVVGEALALELRRKQAEEYNQQPISKGLDPTTRALMVQDGSESEDTSSDEEEDTKIVPKKTREKKTRAVRNRQKRIRAQAFLEKQRKRHKRFLHDLSEIKKHTKELNQQEEQQLLDRQVVQELKSRKLSKPGANLVQKRFDENPIRAPTLPVALTCETDSSDLRRIKPKGSLMVDRMDSLVDRNMANRKQLNAKRIVQGKKRKVRGKDVAHLLQG